MAGQLRRLHDEGELAVTTARAADYIGPRGTTQSPFGDLVIGAAMAPRPARVIGNPDLPHSYTYTVDAAPTPMPDAVAATVAWFRDRRRAG